jgi:hypothetical protein
MVSALARWTVPTVLTLSLGTRAASAAASCPPCTKKNPATGACKACSVNLQLNCGCEPCLGPPYCPSSPVAPFRPSTGVNPSGGGQTLRGNPELINALRRRQSGLERDSLFGRSSFGRADSIFGGTRTPFGRTQSTTPEALRLRRQNAARQGLYERLRETERRRSP